MKKYINMPENYIQTNLKTHLSIQIFLITIYHIIFVMTKKLVCI